MSKSEDSLPLRIERFTGLRSELRALFEQADDSPCEIDGYIGAGEVLVARCGEEVVGHIQFIRSGLQWEIKSTAVLESSQRQGIGTALVRSVLHRAVLEQCAQVVAGTATADIDNLRFYQRLGFRIDRIERDVFTADRGYLPAEANGIPVLDRVWFAIDLNASELSVPKAVTAV